MKEYTTPIMDISIFDNEALTTTASGTGSESTNYVEGIASLENKEMVDLANMSKIVKFTF